jgi:hypothetical protein
LDQPDDAVALARLGRKYAVLRRAVRTELGEQVVQILEEELRTGARIRWALALDEIVGAALARCPNR